MAVEGVELENPIERNSFPLLYCERMLCRFKFNKRTLPICLRPDVTLQVQRIRVAFQLI